MKVSLNLKASQLLTMTIINRGIIVNIIIKISTLYEYWTIEYTRRRDAAIKVQSGPKTRTVFETS